MLSIARPRIAGRDVTIFTRVGEPQTFQVGELSGDVVDRVAQNRRERRHHLHRVGEPQTFQVGDASR